MKNPWWQPISILFTLLEVMEIHLNRWKITQFNPNLILIIILIINGLVVGMAILTDLIWKHTNGSIWTQDEAQYTRKFKKSRQNEKKTRDMKGIIKISQNYFLDIFHFPYIYKFLLKIFWKYFVKLFHLISRVIFFWPGHFKIFYLTNKDQVQDPDMLEIVLKNFGSFLEVVVPKEG